MLNHTEVEEKVHNGEDCQQAELQGRFGDQKLTISKDLDNESKLVMQADYQKT